MEYWKEIKGYEGFYEASTDGRIRSMERMVAHSRFGLVKAQSKILKPALNKDGYLKVALSKDGTLKSFRVHSLVAKTFVDGWYEGAEVNHKDGDKLNNCAENLEWCNRSQNVKHAFDNGLAKPANGSKNGNSKLTEENVLAIKALWNTGAFMQKEIADIYGVSAGHVKDIIHGRRGTWAHLK